MNIIILELKKHGGSQMSRRTSGYYEKGRTSKNMLIFIGFLAIFLLVLPYFVGNIRGLMSSSLYSLERIGTTLQTIGAVAALFGFVLSLLPIIGLRSFSRSAFKILIIGIALFLIGMFLSNPFDILSLFNGGANHKGYH